MTQSALNLVHAFKHLDPYETPVIGGTTGALRMLDRESRQLVAEIGDAALAQRELGRHGNVEQVLKDFNVPDEHCATVGRILDGVQADDLAVSLQRRMGTDADLPPPPVTSRDQVAAAFELHSQGAENA